MDREVIEKIIKHSRGTCPDFKYENPLLDKTVAGEVSRAFVNILNDPNSSDHQRQLVLQNIRKSCKVEPLGHLSIDDNVTELLKNAYEKPLNDNNIKKDMDAFLMRYFKEMYIKPAYPTSLTPDIIQALINLNGKEQEIPVNLLKDIIHWDVDNDQNKMDFLKSLWKPDIISKMNEMSQPDDISIKLKPMIEKQLLQGALEIIENVMSDEEEEEWFSKNEDLVKLVEKCSVSSVCFQICCKIMNALFIRTNFDLQMLRFITRFINSIASKVKHISQLYESNLSILVVLLDIDLDNLDVLVKEAYIESTLKHLHDIHKECEDDVIMLLSHFNKWFDLYYDYFKKDFIINE